MRPVRPPVLGSRSWRLYCKGKALQRACSCAKGTLSKTEFAHSCLIRSKNATQFGGLAAMYSPLNISNLHTRLVKDPLATSVRTSFGTTKSGGMSSTSTWRAASLAAPRGSVRIGSPGRTGLMASLQFKVVGGDDASVEMDANLNRQRSEAFADPLTVSGGTLLLLDSPGLISRLANWRADPSEWKSAQEEARGVR